MTLLQIVLFLLVETYYQMYFHQGSGLILQWLIKKVNINFILMEIVFILDMKIVIHYHFFIHYQ